MLNGQVPYTENVESGSIEAVQNSTEGISEHDNLPSEGQQDTSRKIEVPNNKVFDYELFASVNFFVARCVRMLNWI